MPFRSRVAFPQALNKLKRFHYRSKTSAPYLSGDAFSKISSFTISEFKHLYELNKINYDPRILFSKSEFLPFLEDYLPKGRDISVVISGNSDLEFYDSSKLPSQITQFMYLQNSHISDNTRIFTLPIGVENLTYARNGVPSLLQSSVPWDQKLNKVMIGPFSQTHSDRKFLMEETTAPNDNYVQFHNQLIPRNYAKIQSTFKYVACPRGNGVDTHRFWETLYRGSIPVVKKNSWSASLRYLDVPFIEVSDWTAEEVSRIPDEHTHLKYDPSQCESLWIEYWIDRFTF